MRHLELEIKEGSLTDQGYFEGYASTFGNRDRGGDIIMPGAFTKWMEATGGDVPILAWHKQDRPIGMGKTVIDGKGLYIRGQLDFDLPAAKEIYPAMKSKVVRKLSIGYLENRAKTVFDPEQKAALIHEAEVVEVSAVTIAMNNEANINRVKEFDLEALQEISQKIAREVHSSLSHFTQEQLIARAIANGLTKG